MIWQLWKKEKSEINALVYMRKWEALIETQVKISPVAEDIKWTYVGD